jgi:hypothetical protein
MEARCDAEGGAMSASCTHDKMTKDHDYCLDCGEYRNSWMEEIARLRDWQRRAIASIQEHNAMLQHRCGDGARCGYRPYILNSGRRCPTCPVYEKVDFDDLMEEAKR